MLAIILTAPPHALQVGRLRTGAGTQDQRVDPGAVVEMENSGVEARGRPEAACRISA
jgi:hypothetical protein